MKIFLINTVCGILSTGRICTDLADILTLNGHEVKIAYGRDSVPEKYQKYALRVGNDSDNKMHALRTRIFDDTGSGSKNATAGLIEKIKEFDPDVIHLHNIHGYYINITLLFDYLRDAKKPVVWTLHDCWSFTGHCTHFDLIGCNRYKTGCYSCPQKKQYPASLVFDNSRKNYALKKKLFTSVENMTLVSPSNWLGELAKGSFLSRYPVRIINNGIDLSVFKPTESDFCEKYNIGSKKIYLGVAGTWDDRKGLSDFIRLSEKLDDGERLVLVGLSPKQISDIKSKASSGKIIAIDRTNSVEELAGIYTAADVFLNATYEDNFPTVNIEALACGTPVVTYATGGSVEAAGNDYGEVVEQGDINALLEAAKRCAGRFERKLLTRRAAEYDKKLKYNEYLELYKAMVSTKED